MDKNVRVRFAPSPTGIPHVGNIRTALFDYFLAKAKGGVFILRIEDTDQARKVEGAVEAIQESLTWLGAQWDELATQSERLNEYKKYAEELVAKGIAIEENNAIRFVVPTDVGEISWIDAIGNKKISYKHQDIEDFIILKADGYPTYHLANVVDDHLMDITHVIRGEDWIPSTPKHILLYKAFGWEMPVFAHVPNVLGEDGKKLSKRRGAKSVLDFKKEGYLGEAMTNYLMLLGWSSKDNREVLTKGEIIESFSLENVNVSPSRFDTKKLNWINGEYIRSFEIEKLCEILREFDSEINEWFSEEDFKKFVKSAQTRIKTLAEFREYVEPFKDPKKSNSQLLEKLALRLEPIEDWQSTEISSATISFMKRENIKFPQIYQELIGKKQGLPLGDIFEILGKERTLHLLK